MTYSKAYIHRLVKGKSIKSIFNKIYQPKEPSTKSSYVGLEIEFLIENNEETNLAKVLAHCDIAQHLQLGSDGSIEDELGCNTGLELKICAPETKIFGVVEKVSSILKYFNVETNSSCGLHIHLDHRICTKRNPVVSYNNLFAMQDLLFGLTKNNREGCGFCEKIHNKYSTFYNHLDNQVAGGDYYDDSKYASINLLSLMSRQTIEVRLFHSTIDSEEISHFINMVTGAVNNQSFMKKVAKSKSSIDKIKNVPAITKAFVKNKLIPTKKTLKCIAKKTKKKTLRRAS